MGTRNFLARGGLGALFGVSVVLGVARVAPAQAPECAWKERLDLFVGYSKTLTLDNSCTNILGNVIGGLAAVATAKPDFTEAMGSAFERGLCSIANSGAIDGLRSRTWQCSKTGPGFAEDTMQGSVTATASAERSDSKGEVKAKHDVTSTIQSGTAQVLVSSSVSGGEKANVEVGGKVLGSEVKVSGPVGGFGSDSASAVDQFFLPIKALPKGGTYSWTLTTTLSIALSANGFIVTARADIKEEGTSSIQWFLSEDP